MAMPAQYSQAPHNSQGGYGYSNEYQQQPLVQGGYGGYQQQGGYPPQQGGYPQQGAYPQQPNAANSLRSQTTTSMNLVFFAAACCVMVGSFIGGINLFFKFELVDFLGCCYLFIFGAILAVLDTPFFKTIKAMGDLKMYIGKYIEFLTRVTFKGVTFMFLGSSFFATMWDNNPGDFFMRFLAVVLGLVPFAVGCVALVIGVMKSQKLEKARRHLEMSNIDQRYDQWAQTYRGQLGGLTPTEFNGLTMENGGFKWEEPDLKLIFQALVKNPSWKINAAAQTNAGGRVPSDEPKIPKEDLLEWVKGGLVLL
mmetsp:Transcript_39384/g.89530  ORF Transcript_39384/g.89530 Transcript_39384/m.89530 type:complete len:309 (-) Transcript_39384:173-1099(-)